MIDPLKASAFSALGSYVNYTSTRFKVSFYPYFNKALADSWLNVTKFAKKIVWAGRCRDGSLL